MEVKFSWMKNYVSFNSHILAVSMDQGKGISNLGTAVSIRESI
jgi:hypothetical protein